MRSIVIYNNALRDVSAAPPLIRCRRRWTLGLIASATTCAFTALVGLVFSAASLINVVPHAGRVSVIGALLLAATFPLLILAAHCLDKMDETNAAIREANSIVDENDK